MSEVRIPLTVRIAGRPLTHHTISTGEALLLQAKIGSKVKFGDFWVYISAFNISGDNLLHWSPIWLSAELVGREA